MNDAEANVAPIPSEVPEESANIPLGGSVAIFAQDPVGLMATVGARLLGAGLIIAVDGVSKKLQIAKHFEADVTLDFTKGDPVEEVRRLTGGQGVDSAFECLGAQVTFEDCAKSTRH